MAPKLIAVAALILLTGQAVAEPCITFFGAGVGKLGIRNNCPKNTAAVVSWTPSNPPNIKTYCVGAQNQIVIDMEAQAGQLAGENPC